MNEGGVIKLVIFDMDGLMLDTESIYKKYWEQIMHERGLETPDTIFQQLIGCGKDKAKKIIAAHYGDDFDNKTVREQLLLRVRRHIDTQGVPLKKGLLHILDRLEKTKTKKCVATSSERGVMEGLLTKLNLMHRFDGFVTGDRVRAGKPDPEIFLKAAHEMNEPPETCIVLEDSNAGISAAYAAGMRSILIPDLARPSQETLKRIYARCTDLEEAAEIISRFV